MEEIEVEINTLKHKKQDLEIEIDNFSSNGRSPTDINYSDMVILLSRWEKVKSNIECLDGVLKAIISNIS